MGRHIAALLLALPVLVSVEACLDGDALCEGDAASMLQTKSATSLREQLESGIRDSEDTAGDREIEQDEVVTDRARGTDKASGPDTDALMAVEVAPAEVAPGKNAEVTEPKEAKGVAPDKADGLVEGGAVEPEAELKLSAPRVKSSALEEATMECIKRNFMAMQVPEVLSKLRGRGEDPATICAGVPSDGFLQGFEGPEYKHADNKTGLGLERGWFSASRLGKNKTKGLAAGVASMFGVQWKGKTLKTCLETDASGACQTRGLTNTLEWRAVFSWESEAYNGQWTKKQQSWLDGLPCAQILYPKDMKEAIDELRPWCTCGVRTWLGVLLWKGQHDTAPVPLKSFLLVPSDASENDCPNSKTSEAMCS